MDRYTVALVLSNWFYQYCGLVVSPVGLQSLGQWSSERESVCLCWGDIEKREREKKHIRRYYIGYDSNPCICIEYYSPYFFVCWGSHLSSGQIIRTWSHQGPAVQTMHAAGVHHMESLSIHSNDSGRGIASPWITRYRSKQGITGQRQSQQLRTGFEATVSLNSQQWCLFKTFAIIGNYGFYHWGHQR